MGANTKSLRLRIKSVDSTLHLTKAMGLVASSKIRRANNAMLKGGSYRDAIFDMVQTLAACPDCSKSPYMRQSGGERTRLIVIAGDRGLCGGYNANVFRTARQFPDAEFIPIGKRAWERFGGSLASSETFTRQQGYELGAKLCRDFLDDQYDRLGIICSRYVSMMTQEAQVKWILPIARDPLRKQANMIFEPDEMEILTTAVGEYVGGTIVAAVRESFACEVAARRMAMDSAGKNAQEMIDNLQLEYNRARQSAITQEITEIVAGSGG